MPEIPPASFNRTNKLNIQVPLEDEIAVIEREMEMIDKSNSEYIKTLITYRPNTRKYSRKKRKKDRLADFGNMTEILTEEIKKIKRALSKKPQGKKKVNFKKLFPLLKQGKVKR